METEALAAVDTRPQAVLQAINLEAPLAPSYHPRPWAHLALKRALDVFLAIVGLVLAAPLWATIAIAIKLHDGGPIFYRQVRWGRHKKRIEVLKFRTMEASSEDDHGIQQSLHLDHLVTDVGRLLRSTGLDELPQLWNILRGEMSFVGPRALAIEERVPNGDGIPVSYETVAGFSERLAVRPGLTGPATVYLRKHESVHRKFDADLAYVRNYSLWVDIKLIALSLWVSLHGRWESPTPKI